MRWVSSYPVSGGPRPDQFKAYGWFDSMGWAMAWPLHRAAMRGEAETIRQLCAAGHDPNAKMHAWFDSEPLGWAASLGHLSAVIALIQCGADPLRPPNMSGFRPLTDAYRERHFHVATFLNEYQRHARGTTAIDASRLFVKSAHANGGPRPETSGVRPSLLLRASACPASRSARRAAARCGAARRSSTASPRCRESTSPARPATRTRGTRSGSARSRPAGRRPSGSCTP